MHPRSSISKTPLMLANHTGIVDSGYRGSLIGAFRWLKTPNQQSYILEKHTRLLQICHPSLCRVVVCLVNEEDLTSTTRGEGGFGSTGR
jgi:dUTP pyrophosphatase